MHGKIQKSHTKTINLKYQLQSGKKNFNLLDGSYSVSGVHNYFEYITKQYETVTDNSPIRMYVNKIENRITLRLKTVSYLKLLTPETMKLLKSIKNKITKDKTSENVLHFKNC